MRAKELDDRVLEFIKLLDSVGDKISIRSIAK
jgi:predicted transcriptional regulator